MPQVASGGRGRGVVAAAVMPSKWAAEALDDSGDEQQVRAITYKGRLQTLRGRLHLAYMKHAQFWLVQRGSPA
jgi:hypothetical protein